MNDIQRKAIRLMDEKKLGAVHTKFGFTWRETCRTNPDAAAEVVRILTRTEAPCTKTQ